MNKRTAPILWLLGLGCPGVALAGTYWVSPDGAAAWAACEGQAPLANASACSLDTANSNAAAGDTVTLRGGTYPGGEIRPQNTGLSDSARIVYIGHSGEEVILEGSGFSSLC